MSPREPGLDYPRWIAEALRLVARRALEHVEEEGLPGEHHFLVGFHSRAEGVLLPAFLRDKYPEEVTIVLQNQFWDLVTDDDGFSVTLAFGGARHRVFVPWPALTAFADPGAQLALRFEMAPEGENGAESVEGEPTGGETRFAAPGAEVGAETPVGDPARVVSLDRFRKRHEGDDEAG